MGDHRFVFIGGLHRSGTTLLARCLGEHPAISDFRDTGVPMDEGMFLQTVYQPAYHFGGPGKFAFHPGARLNESSHLATPKNRERIWSEWAGYWDLSKSHLLEKSPPNLIRTRFLQALFPESTFIILVRHPVSVSYATKKWSGSRIYSLLNHWIAAYSIFDTDADYLNRLFILRYEDFVKSPAMVLDQIYAFLDLPSYPYSQSIRADINDSYFARWERFRQDYLRRPKRVFLDWRYEKAIRSFGYSLRDVRWTPADYDEPTLDSLEVRPRFRAPYWHSQTSMEIKGC